MANEYKLSYSGSEINAKLGKIDSLAEKSEIPTKVSQLTNDSGFLTAVPNEYATKTYVDNTISAIPTPDVSGQIGTHNTATDSHNDIRLLIEGLTTRLNALADSDDTTLDQMSEIVAYIKSNKSLIDGITTNKINVSDIINNLTTNVSNKPLSAAQGVALKALIDAITVPTKVSELTNDKGYLTSFTETDPTVPAWAKAASKPTYTKSEVGLGNVDNVKQYSANNPPPYPVTSVNGQTGAVTVNVPITVTSTDGVAYTATAPYITATSLAELKGAKLVIIPDMTSTNAYNVALNVNGLGAQLIKRWDNTDTSEFWSFTKPGWFKEGYPVTVTFNGKYWMIEGMNKPYASDLSGAVTIANGGTGVTSHADTTYTTARYRASALMSAETDPTVNGVINWIYE